MRSCYHCNGDCETELKLDDKVFCCEGCLTVYEILNTNALGQYYSIDKNPGIKASKNYIGKYNFLDLPEFRDKLVSFKEGSIIKIKLFLPQIHCSSCLWLLERLAKLRKGVLQSHVNFVDKEVEVTFNEDDISLRELAELLASIGYPPSITLEDYEKKSVGKKTDKRLIIQIGVTGFCFGNMMLLSFPEYLGIDERYSNFQQVFNYLNLALSVPVLIFGARDYMVSAWKAVRARFINIDVPITLGILAFYFQSLYEILSKTGAGYLDSFAGLIFFLLIGKWFQQTTYGAINFERDYKSYFPIAVSKLENSAEKIVPLRTIKPGDHILIRNNELIPADAVLVKGKANIDYSFVSGESALISKHPGDKLYAGGRQEGHGIEIEIEKEVENSYLTKLWNNPIFDKEKLTTSFTEKITTYFTIGILIIATLGFAYWSWIDVSKSLFVVVSVLIIACPCAIALSVPFTYGNGIRVLGRNAFYMRSAKVIESVSNVTDLVFDKTGTITHTHQSKISWEGISLSNEMSQQIETLTAQSSHPLSRQITRFMASGKLSGLLEDFREQSGKGIEGNVDGIFYRIGSATWVGAPSVHTETRVFVQRNEEILGSFLFSNVYREGLEKLFKSLAANYQLHILSGDNDAERDRLSKLLPEQTQMHFGQQPEDKLNYVASLQKKGRRVMMLGDGLNDAGALRQSNVGVSVVDDVYSFSPSSDVIMDGEVLVNLKEYLDYCTYNKQVVKLSYVFSLTYNVIGLSFALTGTLTPLVAAILMPLSSISVVLLVTLLTNIRGRRFGKSV